MSKMNWFGSSGYCDYDFGIKNNESLKLFYTLSFVL